MKSLLATLTLIAIAAALLTGCKLTKEERRMNRATKKLEKLVSKYPELERTDTVRTIIPSMRVDSFAVITVDTSKVDSLRSILASMGVDSTDSEVVIKYIPKVCNIEPVSFDNDTVDIDIWVDHTGVLRYTFSLKPIEVKQPYETINPVKVIPSQKGKGLPWWVWVVIIGLVVALVVVAVRR